MKFYCKKCNKYRRFLVKKLYDAQSGMLAVVYCRKCNLLLYDWKVDPLPEDYIYCITTKKVFVKKDNGENKDSKRT